MKISTKGYFKRLNLYLFFRSIFIISCFLITLQDTLQAQQLPDIAPPTEEKSDRLSLMSGVSVHKVRLTGNTAFSDDELAKITAEYENKEITSEQLQELRNKLTHHYVDNGYINSGVIIPDQEVIDGIITLRIIEGALTEIRVEDNKYFRSGYISDRLKLAAGPPVNIHDLQQALLVLQQDSRIKRINAKLSPGILPGDGVLNVRVKEDNPFKIGLEVSNKQSPSVGAVRGELQLAHQNLSGNGDMLSGSFGLTEGLFEIDICYALPITARDTMLKLDFRKNETTVIEEPFEDLDIENEAETYGITLSHPFYKTPNQEFTLALTGEVRQSDSFLLGRRFSFCRGAEEGEANVTVLRFSQEWINCSQTQVFAARSTFSLGVDAFGATINDTGEDSRFFSWLGQLQWVKRIGDTDGRIIFRTDIQLANDPLLPLEKFDVGGMDSVRGYRENQLVRDNGAVISLEFRIPLLRNKRGQSILQLAPFTDFGWSWNTECDTPSPRSISSIGSGLIWEITEKIKFQIYGGIPFRNINNMDHDLQDEGVHFSIMLQN